MRNLGLYTCLLLNLFSAVFSQNGMAKSESCIGKTLDIAISSSPSNLNPFFSTDANSQNLNRLLHTSLIDFTRQMTFECRLCDSFEEKFDKDSYKIVFHLKDDVHFWDGTSVTSEDVRNSWKYFTEQKKIKSIFRHAFGNIENVKTRGKYRVEIIYEDFALDHLPNLALLKILKIPEYESLKSIEFDDIVGAGKYQVKNRSALSLKLVPKDLNQSLSPLNFKVVKDETTLALKLINNEVDLSLANMSPRKMDWLKANYDKKLQFWEKDSSNFVYIGINHQHEPFDERDVRKALALLIPRDKIIRYKLKGMATKSEGLFSRAFEKLYVGEDEHNEFNPKKAKNILKSKGYDEKNKLRIDWKVTSNKSTIEKVKTIVQFLEKGPINVNLTIQEWGTYMRSFKQGRFDLIMGQWVGFTGPSMLKFAFHSEKTPPSGGNRGHFESEKVDALIEKAEDTRQAEKRYDLFKEIISIVNRELVYINLWHPKIRWVGQKCLEMGELYPNESFYPLLELQSECCHDE